MAKKLGEQVGNGFDPAIVMRFVTDIERYEEAMASKQGEYMAYCKGQRELINAALDRAKDAGVPKKELKAALKIRKLKRKIEDVCDDLEEDERETLDMIRSALGDLADTPLGMAAAGAAAIDEKADDEFDAAAPEKPAEPDPVAESVTRLRRGMKRLNPADAASGVH
jgi:hypothetical protein